MKRTPIGLALLVGAALALALVGGASGRPAARQFAFSFEGYVKTVKAVPQDNGVEVWGDHSWELGLARIKGSGTLEGTKIRGSFTVRWVPGKTGLAANFMDVNITGTGYAIPPGTKGLKRKTLKLVIVRSGRPKEECKPGLRGEISLVEDPVKMRNGQVSSYVDIGSWSGLCNWFPKVWWNHDGDGRTQPNRGGPGGGQWVRVRIAAY